MAGNFNCGRLTTRDVLLSFVAARMRIDGYVGVRVLDQEASHVIAAVGPVTSRLMDFEAIITGHAETGNYMRTTARDLIARVQPGRSCHNTRDITEGVVCILDGMFEDGQRNWGRLNTVAVYTYMLCVAAMRQNSPDLVLTIINAVSCYFQRHNFGEWIQSRGGWEAMPNQMSGGREQQDPAANDPILRAALTGTALISSILSSVWNAMRRPPPRE